SLRSSIKYNVTNDSLYFLNGWTDDLGNTNWNRFTKESILFLRDIKQCNPANFSPFWENGLVVVPQKNPSSGIYEPFVVWGPHKDFSPTGYQIYWRLGGAGNFTLLATVGPNVYTFRHEGLAIGENTSAEYRVRAVRNQTYSEFTNTASISVSGFFKQNFSIEQLDYSLMQNYPNPFNPTTTIGFSIRETEFVSLRIYDLLGNEVKTLVNEIKTPGIHYVEWEGDNNSGEKLSSGIYFYRLQTEKFAQSKKLILQK
ncbi:MAG: T9SS type A sorting domain-containing protein, partial [Bacteroidetes bacterium]|nr:T9SS type A sorting domain-containing protein [Bacteroidota bacterium]